MAPAQGGIVLTPAEEKMFEGQPRGFPFGDFDLADVMLPEEDDMGIPSGSDDEQEEDLQTDSGFGNVLVVDNLPSVGPEKFDKLTAILTKIFSGSGRIREGGLFHPMDEEKKMSKGYAFVEYENAEQARAAQSALNGYQLDKVHKFAATLFDEADRLAKVSEEYVEPEERVYTPSENLMDWLSDKRGRDQFVLRYGDETEVCWNDAPRQTAESVYKRSFWTDTFVEWSPRGSALATVHRQGVALWGGKSYGRLMRISHQGVQRLLFSPCERYMLTFSEGPDNRGRPHFVAHIWEIRTGKRLRTFDGPHEEYAVGAVARPDGGMRWPAFRWGGGGVGGDKPVYLAHMKRNAISVYEAPEMAMLDKRSLKMEGVEDWDWAPGGDAVLCAYQTEQGNLPARVVLTRLPDREELRQKNLFSVAGIKMTWHPQGDYLAVQVDKWTKTKKSTHTNFELFSMREKDIPIDMLELPNKGEKIHQLAWEPRGHRFAILHGEGNRPAVSIYNMKDTKSSTPSHGVTLVHSMTGKACTSMHWSPAGRFLLLAGLEGGHNGTFEFWDVEEMTLLNAGEHFMAQEVAWDPTGRCVATILNAAAAMENGFQIWSFSGQPMYKTPHDRFFQLNWRPRPPSLLPEEKQREIVKNLRKYSKRYEEEDDALLAQADTEFLAEREKQLNEWRAWVESRKAYSEEREAFAREQLGERAAAHDRFQLQEVEVSVVVEVKEEPAKL